MNKTTHKQHHFVPRTFLKSWAVKDNKNFLIYTLNLKDSFARKQDTSRIAKKKNLYTLPIGNTAFEKKILEHFVFKIWEDRWPSVLKGLNENKLTSDQARDLKGFIINQSFRTVKFQKENKARLELVGDKEISNLSFNHHYAFLGIVGFPKYVKDCTCEIFYINDLDNFICSDNPATHWINVNNNFNYINGIIGRQDLHKNPSYKIVCPVTPKHLAILTPNIDIEINENIKQHVQFNRINKDDIPIFNKMIEHGADKLLFAKKIYDLK